MERPKEARTLLGDMLNYNGGTATRYDGRMRYLEHFLSEQEAEALHLWLLDEKYVQWQQETFQMFGRSGLVPRRLAWYGDPGLNYRYTGIDHKAAGWPPKLAQLRERVNIRCARWHHLPANFVLINRYDHGAEHMGWHKDDEQGTAPLIASLSLGAVRRFRIRHTPDQACSIDLASGSLLMFDGRLSHTLAKTQRPVGTRINLTFRHIYAAD